MLIIFNKKRCLLALLNWCMAIACLLGAATANATNGFNLIGFGAESTLMGGADIAVARDTSALNTNPAGLAQIRGQAFDGFGTVLTTLDLTHQDSLNEVSASNKYTPLGGGGYAKSLDSLPCTAGVGFFAQGGAGGVFKDVKTQAATQDEMSVLLGFAKVIPGMGCQITDKLSIGASVALVYSSLEQKFFPNTSAFEGFKLEGTSAVRFGYKLGVMYKVNPVITLAAAYTEKTELPLTGGELTVDNPSFGKVKYNNASVKGLALPREVALGMAIKPNDDWLLSFKLNWIDWSAAINDITTIATQPDSPIGDKIIVTPGDWKNQLVFATGLAYTLNDRTTLYAGYNYGRNPVPQQNSSALLAAILEHHYTVGAARQISPEWKLSGGLEYMAPAKVNYNNPAFGGAAEVRNEALAVHFMLSRRW